MASEAFFGGGHLCLLGYRQSGSHPLARRPFRKRFLSIAQVIQSSLGG
jgi:hypothetical protein